MHNIKSSAFRLRKQGKSYNEISQKLKVSKGLLSYWFKKLDWSDKIKKRLIIERKQKDQERIEMMCQKNKERWEQWREEARQEAKKEFLKLKKNPLFITGLMLYWGEGDSKIENSIVRLANTNPEMIRIFSKFLQKICNIPLEKIKISLVLYPDLDKNECKTFWSKASGVPQTQFAKIQFIKGYHPTKRLLKGICNIIVCSRALKEKIFVWLKLYQDKLIED